MATMEQQLKKAHDMIGKRDAMLGEKNKEIARLRKALEAIKSICADRIGTLKDMIFVITREALAPKGEKDSA